MASNAAMIERFYAAFARRDAEAMVACYADDVVFADPVFGELRGERAKAMWRMLAGRSRDLVVTYRDVVADGETGRAHWEAPSGANGQGWIQSSHQTRSLSTHGAFAPVECQMYLVYWPRISSAATLCNVICHRQSTVISWRCLSVPTT